MTKKLSTDVKKYLAEIGRKGGKARTEAKLKAIALNAKLGGRPRSKKKSA